jgi:hypothetical protein
METCTNWKLAEKGDGNGNFHTTREFPPFSDVELGSLSKRSDENARLHVYAPRAMYIYVPAS